MRHRGVTGKHRVRLSFDSILALGLLVSCLPALGESAVVLRGAGATFPAPLYQHWIGVFERVEPNVRILYEAVGSGEGIRRFVAGEVDFAASDAAISDEQAAAVERGVRLLPVTAGLVVLAYNLPGLGGPLNLERKVYVDIFAGKITRWNDTRIAAANPTLRLPNATIALVVRQDSSGTTYALTNHLSAISPAWRDRGPGIGKVIDWPGAAMSARGNERVASRIKLSEGSIGYVEYGFAKRLGLPMAWLENKAGRFIEPSERSGELALAAAGKPLPDRLKFFMPDPDGNEAYPIVTLSWLLLYGHYAAPERAAALKRFVTFGLTQGQAFSGDLGYIRLPPAIAEQARGALEQIQ